jgi:hypothetical protein
MTPNQLYKHLKQWALDTKLVEPVGPTMPKTFHVCGAKYYFPLTAVNSVLKEAACEDHVEAAMDQESKWCDSKLNELYKCALVYRLEHKL